MKETTQQNCEVTVKYLACKCLIICECMVKNTRTGCHVSTTDDWFNTCFIFAAAFSGSQNPPDGIDGGMWGCRGNRWCWWHCRGRGQCWEWLIEEAGGTRKKRGRRKTYQLHKSQTGLCSWWSCEDRGNSLSPRCRDLCSQVTYNSPPYLLMELMLGTLSWSHTRSRISWSLISQANMVGLVCFRCRIIFTTFGVATLGLEPPITPGLMLPVSLYLQ